MEVCFIIAQPIGKTKKFKLTDGEYVIIGRDLEKCQVPLSDEMCSSKHCKISLTNNCIFVEDLNSKNGIYLNGARVIKQRFYLDDKLKVGDSVMYINSERLSSEDITYLTHQGETSRVHKGYTLELVMKQNKSSNSLLPVHKQDIAKQYKKTRQKAYANQRESREKPEISIKKLQILEMIAFGIDILVSILVFYMGITAFKFFHAEEYRALSERMTSYQIIFSSEMSSFTFFSFIAAVIFYSLNRGYKRGSIGEKILRID